MAETFDPLVASFSTADAEAPILAYDQGILHVRFRDWREREVIFTFGDVSAFSWDDGDAAWSDAHRDDSAYIVVGSEWLRKHMDVGTIAASEGHRHYKLCFNAVGVLQVIASGLLVSD
jgi:hypothetical protein